MNAADACLLGIALSERGIAIGSSRLTGSRERRIDLSIEPDTSRDADSLISVIDRLLRSCGLSVVDLTGVAFSAGPGGFTRVRIACAVAQGLAMGRGLPVACVDSLAVRALAASSLVPIDGEIIVVSDARMGQIYAATFTLQDGYPQPSRAAALIRTEDLAGWLQGGGVARADAAFTATGDAFDRLRQALSDTGCFPPGTRFVQPDAELEIRALLAIASELPLANWVTPAMAAPRYLREKVALDVHEQAELRARGPATGTS